MKQIFTLILLLFTVAAGYAQTNKKLATTMKRISESDQQYRVAASASAKKYRWGRQADSLMNLQEKIDQQNLKEVEQIIAKYGYPGKTLVGDDLQSAAFMVIQHNDQPVQEKYLPLLTEAANKGELKWSSLALMIDRVKVGRGEKQVYGTQLEQQGDIIKLQPIEDEANVNVRRAKIGLPPLEDYLKQWNINYQLPTAAGNPNPADMYVQPVVHEESPVELIGGYPALYAKVVYPDDAKKNNIKGYVTLELAIDKDGTPKDIQVVKPLGHGCDEEAVRVMKTARFTNNSGGDHEIRIRIPFGNPEK